MPDKRFIKEHRKGLPKKEQHIQLINWSCRCSEKVLHLFCEISDERLKKALVIVKEWANGNASVSDSMKASAGTHAAARESSNPISTPVARSVGHAVAAAHMANHSSGAVLYALKAVKNADKSVDTERKWQNEQLPSEIKGIVQTAMFMKEKAFKTFSNCFIKKTLR
jgi:hypothetical protein